MGKVSKAVSDYMRKISGASAGGKARAAKLTPERRTEIARAAGKARHAASDKPTDDPAASS